MDVAIDGELDRLRRELDRLRVENVRLPRLLTLRVRTPLRRRNSCPRPASRTFDQFTWHSHQAISERSVPTEGSGAE
ncbi:hypothetical protein Jiend_30040 [Micromonospora endophytica]|nr:hypothetical protein Jiend_30040 [Micromonospora endophytica]